MKIMLLKIYEHYGYDYQGDICRVVANNPEWIEVEQKEFDEIQKNVEYANSNIILSGFRYVIIQASKDNFLDEIGINAKEFHEKIEAQKKAEAEKKAEAARKRKEKALERKQKNKKSAHEVAWEYYLNSDLQRLAIKIGENNAAVEKRIREAEENGHFRFANSLRDSYGIERKDYD